MILNFKNKKLLVIPIILAIILALKPTLTLNGPLSWDIYTHVNYALAYITNGVTTVDPFLNAPFGKQIGYSPLFHFILIIVATITHTDLLTSARILQPILAGISTLTIVYVAYKLYGKIAGISAGTLLLSSFMFSRLVLPIPETIAVIFFTLGIYFYYNSIIGNNKLHAVLAGILGLLILSVHFSTFIYYLMIITMLMLCQLIYKRQLTIITSYLYVLLPIILMGILGLITLMIVSPDNLIQVISSVISMINDPMSLFMGQKAMGLERYLKCVGILPLLFGIIGLIYSFKDKKHRLIVLWALMAFVITNLHWIGIPVYTFRLLIYFIIPLVILGGYGLSELIKKCDISIKGTGSILLLIIIILSFGIGYTTISDPSVTTTSVTTAESTLQIAPPTQDETELINWFKTQDTNNSSVLTNNLFFGMVLSSSDKIPLHYSFDVYATPSSHKSSIESLNNESIGYIVYDKSLVMKNSTNNNTVPEVEYVKGDYYPLYYYTQPLNQNNFEKIQLPGTTKVFENNRFIVCKVNGYNNLK